MYILQGLGLDVQVVTIPSGKDPDDLLSSSGGQKLFEQALEKARPLVLQHLAAVQPLLDRPETRRSGVESLFGGLAQLQPSALAPSVPQLAGALNLRVFVRICNRQSPCFFKIFCVFHLLKAGRLRQPGGPSPAGLGPGQHRLQ